MKKFLSLILVAAMLVAVLAMVGCDEDVVDTTTEPTTEATTTATEPTTETTTPAPTTETTTKAPETETTTKAPETETTTKAPETETTTQKPVETTTKAPETDATTAATTTGTTVPMFARFDFGTKTKAEDEGLTSHDYLTSILTYNEDCISIVFTEDTWVIYAKKDYTTANANTDFALCFEDIVTYDFDAEFIPGFGGWNNAPLSSASIGTNWQGKLQYMQIRLVNATSNNMISMHWHRAGEGYSTRTLNSCMYLQGGAPASASNHNLTTTPTNDWATYTYDMAFLASVGREFTVDGGPTSYYQAVEQAKARGGYAGHNWNTANGNITAIQFHFLGAYGRGQTAASDSRANIKMGNKVEVDYVIFGSSIDQLNEYTSYIEDAAK